MDPMYTSRLRELLLSDIPLESALASLRSEGASPIEVIKAIRSVKGVNLGEAKMIFNLSPSWYDVHKGADQLHEEITQALIMDATENNSLEQ